MNLINPVPSSNWDNNGGYDSDSGLDILVPVGTKCVCAADGIVEYAERGHTPWFEDTNLSTALFDPPHSVRIRLDNPLEVNGASYPFIWYTHLFKVDSSILNKFEVPIKAGDPVGLTGIGNRVPHLHFGIVFDRRQSKWVSHKDIAKLIWGSGSPRARSEVAKGSFGPTVRELQKILTSVSKLEDNLELDPKGIDGDFGDNTEKAVKAFQKSRNLPASGKVDAATWKELVDSI
jgi:murein DD-endopeptidase MepM/ murein hydrolase activator NlpD